MNKKAFLRRVKPFLKSYYDFNDCLTDEEVKVLLFKEDGLLEIENMLWDFNYEYIIYEIERLLDNEGITDENEREDLRYEMLRNWDLNIKDLLRNSSVKLRVTLLTDEDFICVRDIEHSETFKHFKRVFRGKYKSDELRNEISNMCGSDYAHIVFLLEISGKDILKLADELQQGRITLPAGISFGLFNSWAGAGSLLGMTLLKPITLNIRDWTKRGIENYNVRVQLDSDKYGIKEVYGLVPAMWKKVSL